MAYAKQIEASLRKLPPPFEEQCLGVCRILGGQVRECKAHTDEIQIRLGG